MSFTHLKRLLYTFSFFDEFILIYPLYAVMFADSGLSAAQISSLFIAWSVTAFLLEIPSGSIADKYSRKKVLLWAVFFKTLAFTAWLFMPDYIGFLLGFICWGVNSALASGTTEAFVYDELQRLDKTKAYARVIGQMESMELVGMTVAALLAGGLAQKGYSLLLTFSILAVLISGIIVQLLPQAKKTKSTGEDKYLDYLINGIRLAWRRPNVLVIIAFSAIVTGWGAVDEYWELLFKEQGMSNPLIAFWVATILTAGAAASALAYKIEKHIAWLPILLGLLGISLFIATLLPVTFSPLAFGVYIVIFYISKVLFDTSLQQEIDDKTRATTTSVGGFVAEIFALLLFGIFALSAHHSYAFGVQIIATLVLIGAVSYWMVNRYLIQATTTKL